MLPPTCAMLEMERMRERIAEAQTRNFKHDISVPISRIADFVDATSLQLTERFPGVRMLVLGHVGDGNLHYNVEPPPGLADAEFAAMEASVHRLVYDAVEAAGGSISAEHGIGQLKTGLLKRVKDPVALEMMRAIKQALDPNGTLNPGKVLG